MAISEKDFEKISQLAYLDVDTENSSQLIKDINLIMNFVEQLRSVDTNDIIPLFHPIALNQRLRPDTVTEDNCLDELESLAPRFENNLYLVPQVIEQGK